MTDGPHLGDARRELDSNLTAPTKLTIMAVLVQLDEIEFGALRDATGLSDSALSKQLSSLQAIGYLDLRKGYVGRRPRTWVRAAERGRDAFARHVVALDAVIRPR